MKEKEGERKEGRKERGKNEEKKREKEGQKKLLITLCSSLPKSYKSDDIDGNINITTTFIWQTA